jgi:hypothetical protein
VRKEIKMNQLLNEKSNLERNIDFFTEKFKNKENPSSQIIGKTVEKMKENVEKIEKDIEDLEDEKEVPPIRNKDKIKIYSKKEKSSKSFIM